VELKTAELPLDRRMRNLQEKLITIWSHHWLQCSAYGDPGNQEGNPNKHEAARREFQSQLEQIRAWIVHGRGIQSCASSVKPPKCDGTSSWTVFRRQFETIAEHNCWMSQKKSTHLIIALQSQATDVLHGIPKRAPIPFCLTTT
jgi:hypothetical protein